MAEVDGATRQPWRGRVVEKVARAVAGDQLERLEQRIRDLESEVQECRQLNLRLAEVTDLLEQVLLPAAARDEARIAEALEKYTKAL